MNNNSINHMKLSRLLSAFIFVFLMAIPGHAQRVMEKLNRGLVAVRVSSTQTFLSWRVYGYDPDNIEFNLYRNGVKINSQPISSSSNYSDTFYAAGTTYVVKPAINGVETGESHQTTVLANNYIEIPLNIPATMTMPDNTTCTFSPNDCSVGDVDGDGEYEIFVKWEPTNAKDNSQGGYTGNVFIDCYKLNGTRLWRIDLGINIRAGAHYTQFVVADFDGDGKAELAVKTAPGTKDASGSFISKGPAATATHSADYRNTSGYILTGPEYLTVFSGQTGLELATVNYDPPRGTVSSWGDNYGNRVDRFLASAAWLDGVLPSIVMMRGYYTRAVVAAWDFRNGQLTKRWTYDSGTSNVGLYGQGNHSTSVGDATNNGRDDILWGSGALNHNGQLLYRTGHGHGDAMHVSDMDPDRPGLEVWSVKESTGSPYGQVLHDARTGEVIWGTHTGTDNGRGMAGNLLATNRGFEMWSSAVAGIRNVKGVQVNTSKPSVNFRIYWTGDLQSELLDGTSITKYLGGTIFSATGCSSNNGTKSTPNLSADIFGDWREEVIFRTSDNSKLRIFTTTTITPHKMYTLMHDDVYRNAIIWQNTAYNQPPHAGFYIGADMDIPPASPVYNNELRYKSGTTWDVASTIWNDSTNKVSAFKNGDKVLFDLTAGAHANISVNGNISPAYLKFNSPFDVTLSGPGSLTGNMYVRKTGAGKLIFNGNNTFTGKVTGWSGQIHNNGTLASEEVSVRAFTTLGGSGIYDGNVTLGHNSSLFIGQSVNTASAMKIQQNLVEEGKVDYTFDFQIAGGQVVAHDTLYVGGNWTMNNKSTFKINILNGNLPDGSYPVVKVGGNISGSLASIIIEGIPTNLSYYLKIENGALNLVVKKPSQLIWNGAVDARWDLAQTQNWLVGEQQLPFAANDTVVFNDNAQWKTLLVSDLVEPGAMIVDAAANYTIGGTGVIGGKGSLIKNGTGTLTLSGTNTFTGVTYLNEGTIQTTNISDGGVNSPLGASAAAPENFRFNGGKLHYTGSTRTIDRGFTLGSNGGIFSVNSSTASLNTTGRITGPGKLIKEGSGRLGLSVANNYTGGTLIRGGSIELLSDAANNNGLGTDTITLMGGNIIMFESPTTSNTSNWKINIPMGSNGTITTDTQSTLSGSLSGRGTLNYNNFGTANLFSTDASEFYGIINVATDADGGDFVVYNTKGYPNTRIHLNNLVRMIYRVTSNITIPIGELTGHAGSILGAGGSAACTINWEVGARNNNSAFAGTINNSQFSGTGSVARITKVGTGVWTLTNASTYTGGTFINAGTLMVNNTTGSGTGTGDVVVNQSGTLSGSGTIAGKVIVNNGGTLAPGNGTGILSCDSDVVLTDDAILEIDIAQGTPANDLLRVKGTLQLNGTLKLNIPSGYIFKQGDVISFVDGTVQGLPLAIDPAFPQGNELLAWDLSELATGKLKVKQTSTDVVNPELQYQVYPNPFNDNFRIDLAHTVSTLTVTVYNLTGARLLEISEFNTRQMLIPAQNLSAGSYIIEIKADDTVRKQKLIKK
jgi:autotransporter-associated beta strand protein